MSMFTRMGLAALLSVAMVATAYAQTGTPEQREAVAAAEQEQAEAASSAILLRPAKLTVERVSLYNGLLDLQESSGVSLVFSPSGLPRDAQVQCECSETTVEGALDRLLSGTGLRYSVVNPHILIEPRELQLRSPGDYQPRVQLASSGLSEPRTRRTAMVNGAAIARATHQEGTITGRVVDARTDQPLSGAQVFVPDTGAGTLTNADGEFTLSGVAAGEVAVRVQMIGYGAGNRTVTVVEGETVAVNFELREQALGLDEIVVTGTAGQARRREVGNTISQINVGEIAEPVASVDALIQGRAPGATVMMGSGVTGGGAAIRLRGNVSVAMSNQPLIYVDGVRARSDMYPINRSEAMHWINSANETPSPLNDINPNDIERIEIIKGAAATTLYGTEAAGGVIQIFTKRGSQGDHPIWTAQVNQRFDRILPFGPATNPYMNMEPHLQTASQQHYDLSVSGGSSDIQYFLSGMFEDGNGLTQNDAETRRGMRGNFTFDPWNNLTLQWSTSYTDHDFRQTPTGQSSWALTYNAMRAPNAPLADDIDQVYRYLIDNENDRFTTALTATFTPWSNVTNRLAVGYDRAAAHMTQEMPYGHPMQPRGMLTDRRWMAETITVDYAGNIDFPVTDFVRNSFSFGGQSITTRESDLQAWASGFPGPGRHTITSAGDRLAYQSGQRVINAGVFAQNLFDFYDRYFLTLGVRIDGNSAFGQNLGLQAYPKASLSYVISDESFWPAGAGEVKLRGAYGMAGRAPGAFDAVRTWSGHSFGGQSAFWPQNVGNPDLGPERTAETEFGFDASFFDDRLGIDFTRYHQRTSDALFNVRQVPSLGFTSSQLENVGVITNQGVEVSVRGTVLRQAGFNWDIGGGLSTNHSMVEDMGGAPAFAIGASGYIEEGQPIPVIRGMLVTNPEEFADPDIERQHHFGPGAPTHTIQGNTSLSLPWLGMQISGRGEFMGGHYIRNEASHTMANRGAGAPSCQTHAYDHVPHDSYPDGGDLSQVSALYRARCYSQNSSGELWIFPADFFKVRDVTLQMPVPIQVPGTSSTQLSLSARNFWTWTNRDFWDMDPEMAGWHGADVLARQITEQLPTPASATVSLRVVF